jgi:hypothetical protein
VPQDVQKARALLTHNPREEAQALLKELPADGKKSVAR